MKYWIARNEKGFLFLYDDEPFEYKYEGHSYWRTYGNYYSIDDDLFPEITYENSPQEVELKLIEK
jgi:hypothetical protein